MITKDFIRDLITAVQDVVDNHLDDIINGTDIKGGFQLWAYIVMGSISGLRNYLKSRDIFKAQDDLIANEIFNTYFPEEFF